MTDVSIRVDTTGDTIRITVVGEIDLDNVQRVESEIAAGVTNLATEVSIDLADVTYLDSTAVRMLFDLAHRFDSTRTALTLVAPLGTIARRVIDLSGLTQVTTVHP
jgi:anti-sigma B factor antagonist